MVLNHRLRAPLNLNLLSTLAWNEHAAAVGWRSYGRKNNSSVFSIDSCLLLSSLLSLASPRKPSKRPISGESRVNVSDFRKTRKTRRTLESAERGRRKHSAETRRSAVRSYNRTGSDRILLLGHWSPVTMVNCISKHAGVERMHRPLIHRTRSIVERRSVRSRPRHRAEWNRAERSG